MSPAGTGMGASAAATAGVRGMQQRVAAAPAHRPAMVVPPHSATGPQVPPREVHRGSPPPAPPPPPPPPPRRVCPGDGGAAPVGRRPGAQPPDGRPRRAVSDGLVGTPARGAPRVGHAAADGGGAGAKAPHRDRRARRHGLAGAPAAGAAGVGRRGGGGGGGGCRQSHA
ncbi:hypothetical protein I4F81_004557 [Pyropia yezoensis]|uniref:Uncharacterized protein n=1 Tax=Pyropia yezoensis TaxID=2788 RepID=A0ACC3BWY4_PYRYE|nr:hypothetical protein I4F81_004557 [Neopyropia yezoensis]